MSLNDSSQTGGHDHDHVVDHVTQLPDVADLFPVKKPFSHKVTMSEKLIKYVTSKNLFFCKHKLFHFPLRENSVKDSV
jgi:hypothetical protein